MIKFRVWFDVWLGEGRITPRTSVAYDYGFLSDGSVCVRDFNKGNIREEGADL